MSATDRYTMLMASLPHLALPRSGGAAVPFVCDRTPINRIRLEQRLGWMDDDDRALLGRIERALAWELLPIGVTDRELVATVADLLAELADRGAAELARVVQDRFELRTLVAGLRRRQAGQSAPTEVFGDPETCARIRRGWNAARFGLGALHGWLADAERLLRAGDAVGLERLLITASWRQLEERGFGHHFDLVAVVVWVLKWGLIDRAVRHDPGAADRRFHTLLDAARAGHALSFAPQPETSDDEHH